MDIPDIIAESNFPQDTLNEMKKIQNSALGRKNNSRKEAERRANEIKKKEELKLKREREKEIIKATVRAEINDIGTLDRINADVNEVIEENVSGRAIDKIDVDPRIYVIPSKLYTSKIKNNDLTKKEAADIDNSQFESRMQRRFDDEKISDYIEAMFDFFDIQPYYKIERKIKSKNDDVKTEYETVPNDLPLFSKFAFSVGLTQSDISYLRETFPRFEHAYQMCIQIQENILVINMLNGLYGSNASMFTAKNLLGWNSKEDINITGAPLESIINRIQDNNSDDFVVDFPINKKLG